MRNFSRFVSTNSIPSKSEELAPYETIDIVGIPLLKRWQWLVIKLFVVVVILWLFASALAVHDEGYWYLALPIALFGASLGDPGLFRRYRKYLSDWTKANSCDPITPAQRKAFEIRDGGDAAGAFWFLRQRLQVEQHSGVLLVDAYRRIGGVEAQEQLQRVVSNDYSTAEERRASVSALASGRFDGADDFLVDCLESKSPEVRVRAIFCIGLRPTKDTIEALSAYEPSGFAERSERYRSLRRGEFLLGRRGRDG